jgi:hypothetical protein
MPKAKTFEPSLDAPLLLNTEEEVQEALRLQMIPDSLRVSLPAFDKVRIRDIPKYRYF